MSRAVAACAAVGAAAAAALLVSGGEASDPRTPPALPGRPAPFLGTVVLGGDRLSAALDAYGNLVDLRLPGAAGEAQIANPAARQSAGTVERDTGIVLRAGAGEALPLWRATRLTQRYRAGTNVAVTRASVGGAELSVTDAAAPSGAAIGRTLAVRAPRAARLELTVNLDLGGDAEGDRVARLAGGFRQRDGRRTVTCRAAPPPKVTVAEPSGDARAVLRWRGGRRLRVGVTCAFGTGPGSAEPLIRAAAAADRRWIARAEPLGASAPGWARALHDRSLLVLRGLTGPGGALAAGARDEWSYAWPRDAATGALAFAAAGYGPEARAIAGFLNDLDLDAAARFHGDGAPVLDGRAPQGDAAGWVAAAAEAAGVPPPARLAGYEWRGRADYAERPGDDGDYLANAIAAGVPAREIAARFATPRGLTRSGPDGPRLDAAVAWAVEPFGRPALHALVRRSLRPLVEGRGRFGIEPMEGWPGEDPWTAPTAWTAWALAALGDRRGAREMLGALRRAATPAGALPERADALTGVPRSTTPLAWSHAFAVLALRELYPRR